MRPASQSEAAHAKHDNPTCHNRVGETIKTAGNRSSSGEILQTHRDKAAPFDKTKIVSGFFMVFSNCFH